jgi:hypothetical protein
MAQNGLVPSVLFSLYVKDMPAPLHHVDLALHMDVTAIVVNASCQLFGIYLSDFERYLRSGKCYQLLK